MNVAHIAQGKINRLRAQIGLPNQSAEEKAVAKRAICATCFINRDGVCSEDFARPHAKTGQLVKGCGCPIEDKIRSDSPCPAGEWE